MLVLIVALFLAGAIGPRGAGAVELAQLAPEEVERSDSAGLQAAEDNLRQARTRFGSNSPRLLGPLARAGNALLNNSRYADAEAIFREQLRIAEASFPRDSAEVSRPLFFLGETYRQTSRCAEAESYYSRALAAREKNLGPEHPDVGRTLNGRALCARILTRYGEAEAGFKRAIAILEKDPGPDSVEVASAIGNLGELYRVLSRYAEAQVMLLRELQILEKALAPDDPRIARGLVRLARVYRRVDRSDEAETLLKRALAIREARFGSSHESVATVLVELGHVGVLRGRYGEAELLYRRALSIREAAFGPNHLDVAEVIASLGETYYRQGRYNESMQMLERARSIDERLRGADHPQVAQSLHFIGLNHMAQSRLEQAEAFLGRALQIREKAFGADHAGVASALADLANAISRRGRHEEAIALLRRAIAIHERVVGPDSVNVSGAAYFLALTFMRLRSWAEAEPYLKRALAIQETTLGPTHIRTGRTLNGLALVAAETGRIEQALDFGRRSVAVFQARGETGRGARDGANIAEQTSVRGIFIDQISVLYAAQREAVRRADRQAAERFAAEAVEVAQLAQATGTDQAVARMAARFASGSDALANVVRAREDLIERWKLADGAYLGLAGQPAAERDAKREAASRAELRALDARIKELDLQIAKEFPEYGSLAAPQPATLAELQTLLKPDEALVMWLSAQSRTYILAVRRDRVAFERADIGRTALDASVRALRRTLDPSNVTTLADVPPFDVTRAHELYKAVLAPVEPILAGARHVMFIPDGGLQSLPVGVLVSEKPVEPGREYGAYAEVAWLARRHATSVLPSAGSLRALRRFARAVAAREPFLGVGNPLLEGPPGATRGLNVAALYARGAIANVSELRKLPPLPETADELRAIAKALGAPPTSLLLGERANERELRRNDLRPYRVVAFATHGLMAGEFAELGEPALVLTPPRQGSREDDGLLTASEIATLKLDADWVLLSACNTAAADGTPGAEGLSGLARAFFYAGARALLVSHWAVLSDATVKLTTAIFERLAANPTLGRAEAHRQAMLALMRDPQARHYAHPMFWAPFVVVGEGG